MSEWHAMKGALCVPAKSHFALFAQLIGGRENVYPIFIVYQHCHAIFDMWRLTNCCYCFVDTSYTCWQCENLVKLLCFDLVFRIKVSGHIVLAILVFSCLVCVSSLELKNFVERHFLCHQNVAHLYKWAFVDNKLFPLHIMQIETILP